MRERRHPSRYNIGESGKMAGALIYISLLPHDQPAPERSPITD